MTRPGRDPHPRGRLDPPEDTELDDRVRAVLDSLTPDGRAAMAAAGRRICDQYAAEATARRDIREASHAMSEQHEHGRRPDPALQRALRRATPARTEPRADGTSGPVNTRERADQPDTRALARELGRDRVMEMLAVLDRDDHERRQQGGRAECSALHPDTPSWAAPERCARLDHDGDDRHQSRTGTSWQDPGDGADLPEPRRPDHNHDAERADDHVQERVR